MSTTVYLQHIRNEQCITLTGETYLYATLEAQGEWFGILQSIDQHLKYQLSYLCFNDNPPSTAASATATRDHHYCLLMHSKILELCCRINVLKN